MQFQRWKKLQIFSNNFDEHFLFNFYLLYTQVPSEVINHDDSYLNLICPVHSIFKVWQIRHRCWRNCLHSYCTSDNWIRIQGTCSRSCVRFNQTLWLRSTRCSATNCQRNKKIRCADGKILEQWVEIEWSNGIYGRRTVKVFWWKRYHS